ncbi:hypothetical protein CULC809_00994 [Corynebacterium ulcerans 809]|uniref:DoxX family protein n=1 Tax=Corynebacterium ulcerans TaxID=65058 RepID=UPI000218525E|nr:DoxX family protein [Corynebacterium ulcerans]AEG81530.1 hypothetical protein CULC809_00994 [Corynebacterium ulcerans 809]
MIRKIARPMLASVYIADGADTVLNSQAHVEGTQTVLGHLRTVLPRKYYRQIPDDPKLITQAVGGAKIGAGTLLALGKSPRLAATTLAALSIPTILARHAFWETQDREEKTARKQGFLTSVALLGGLAITSVDTAGKPSLKWRADKAAQKASAQIQQALPTKSETDKLAEQAQETASAFASTAKDWIGDATDKVTEYAQAAQDYVEDNKDDWLATAQSNAKIAKKKAVKVAAKAQERAAEAYAQAEKSTGRSAKKASKKASRLQNQAEKSLNKAMKRFDGAF